MQQTYLYLIVNAILHSCYDITSKFNYNSILKVFVEGVFITGSYQRSHTGLTVKKGIHDACTEYFYKSFNDLILSWKKQISWKCYSKRAYLTISSGEVHILLKGIPG